MDSQEVDLSQLSDAQQAALQQYTAVTDSEIPAAIALLQRSEWNPQIAITKFFDGEGPDPVEEARAAQNTVPIRQNLQQNLHESLLHDTGRTPPQHVAPRIVPQVDDSIRRPPFILTLLASPVSLLFRALSSAFGLFGYLFPFLPRLFRGNTAARRTKYRPPLKPRDAVARLRREFEEEYGSNRLPIFEGGYAQALDEAKKHLKFLFVVLISPEHDDTSSFIHETLLSERVQQYLNDPTRLILWIGDVRDAEAYEVSTALRCTKFPFTAVVGHDSKPGSTSMLVLERIPGPMDVNTYMAKLQKAVNTHEAQLADLRATRSAQNFSRNIRQAQDTAYERSLAADRERKRAKEAAEAEALARAEKEREAAEAAEQLSSKKLQWRKWRATQIKAEPSLQDPDTVRIALKMPEAARVTRRFRSGDDFNELYAYVDCYDLIKDGSFAEKVEGPTSYQHKFDFRLVQTLPRVVFDVESGGTIGERVGKSGNLIVEFITDEDDDE